MGLNLDKGGLFECVVRGRASVKSLNVGCG